MKARWNRGEAFYEIKDNVVKRVDLVLKTSQRILRNISFSLSLSS